MTVELLERESSVGAGLRDAIERLVEAGVSNAAWEAGQMMSAALGEKTILLPMRSREAFPEDRRGVLEKMLQRRLNRKRRLACPRS